MGGKEGESLDDDKDAGTDVLIGGGLGEVEFGGRSWD